MRPVLLAALVLGVWLTPAARGEEAPPAAAAAETAPDHATEEGQHAAEATPAEEEGEPISHPEAGPAEKELIASIKMLFAAQDAVAAGHKDARGLQGSLLQQIVMKRYGDNPMSGSDALAAYLAGYLLSGGDTRLVEALVASSRFGEASANLLNGCTLYRKGKREDALKALEGVDLAALPVSALGRVALARAVLTPDAHARERLLSIAIASMPGTLVEEGALRRSALGFSEMGDRVQFWRRVDRYTRRFPNSGYLPDFIQQVAGAAARFSQSSKAIDTTELDRSLSRLPQDLRRTVYVTLARLASSRHTVSLIDYSASRLSRIAVPGSQEEQIALLYLNAYRLLDGADGEQRKILKTLDAELLPEQERKLLQAALAVSNEVDAPLEPAGASAVSTATPLTARAQAALQNADTLLQEPL